MSGNTLGRITELQELAGAYLDRADALKRFRAATEQPGGSANGRAAVMASVAGTIEGQVDEIRQSAVEIGGCVLAEAARQSGDMSPVARMFRGDL